MVYPNSMALTTAIDSERPVRSGAGRTSHADCWVSPSQRRTHERRHTVACRGFVSTWRSAVYLSSAFLLGAIAYPELNDRAPRHGCCGENESSRDPSNWPEWYSPSSEGGVYPFIQYRDRYDDRKRISGGQCRQTAAHAFSRKSFGTP